MLRNLSSALYVAIAALLLFNLGYQYTSTLQTIPNGSEHRMMIDVGETQAVLNTWGTLHATGYPHYVITGNLLTALLRILSVDGVTAAALVSLIWAVLALIVLSLLVIDLTGQLWWGVFIVAVFGLTRFVWVHAVVAEIYSFGLLIQVILFWLAVTPRNISHRISWLALLGGIGVAHHRGIAFMALGLIVAAWPYLWPQLREKPTRLLWWLFLGVLGFLPYVYLPLRADARWAYGELDTLRGVWIQFRGEEANWLMHWPHSSQELWENTLAFWRVLVNELSVIGIIIGAIGLTWGILQRQTRRAALMFSLVAALSAAFSCILYYDILATLVLNVTIALLFGIVFVMQSILTHLPTRLELLGVGIVAALCAGLLVMHNASFVEGLVTDPTGLETIALAELAPADSTLMLAWGPRYFAVGVAQDVQGRLQHIDRVDHRGDFRAILASGRQLVTAEYTFYAQPVSWWQDKLKSPVYLQSIAPRLVEIRTTPTLIDPPALPSDDGAVVVQQNWGVDCSFDDEIVLWVEWVALEKPTKDMSVMVHLLDEKDRILANADVNAPVYGWRPLTTWLAGEQVLDHYLVPRLQEGKSIRLGLYEYIPPQTFLKYNVLNIPITCP
ncbi:MAG: hypothetical protein CUN55_02610 [Phototrophicales bacterium]|nr:MAG: hypothetical protein CUN55_02610 [Phototrophicales bacterium]